MDTTMELDELKSAWQTLDRRLQQQNALGLQLFRDGRVDRARRGLRPLLWGQLAQMLGGAALVVMAALFWTSHRAVPHLLLAGVVLHVYGLMMIVFGGITLALMQRIDYSAPVLAIQKQLAQLRSFYIRNGLIVGCAWWLLWVPFLMLYLMGMYGVDLYLRAPSVIYGGTAVGILGLLAFWWLHRLARNPGRARLATFVDDSMTGASLRRAQAQLDEIARFERDGA